MKLSLHLLPLLLVAACTLKVSGERPDATTDAPAGPDSAAADATSDDAHPNAPDSAVADGGNAADGHGNPDATTACGSGTLVFDTDFEDQSLSAMWTDGDVAISQEQVYSGSYSVVYRFTGAGHFGLTNMSPHREVYVEFWAYLDDMPCVSSCDSAGKHFFRFAWWPDKNGGIEKQIDTGMLNGNVGAFWFSFEPETAGEWASYGDSVHTGTWQRIRAAYRANTTGSADGRFVWMFDDDVVLDLTDEFFGAGDALDTFMFTNYNVEPGDGITNPRIFIDELVVRTGPGSFDCLVTD